MRWRPAHQFIDCSKKGHMKLVVAASADEASVIDDLPPYEWQGAGASCEWVNGFDAIAKEEGITAARDHPWQTPAC